MVDLKLIIIAFVFLLASTFLMYQFIVHQIDGKINVKQFLQFKIHIPCLLIMGLAFVIANYIFAKGLMSAESTFMRAVMNAEVFLWLTSLGYIDYKERIIPNSMIVCGLVYWGLLVVIDIVIAGTPWYKLLIFSMAGGLIIGGVMFIIAVIVKTALGMGDVKMFAVLGLLYGVMDTYSILLFTIVIMAIISVVLLIAKKVTAKTAVPMAPFAAIGFFLSILAGM